MIGREAADGAELIVSGGVSLHHPFGKVVVSVTLKV